MTGKLTVGPDGRLRGPATLSWNDPFPVGNGDWGSGAMLGVLMHTMVADLPGTVAWFNNPEAQVSAHFGISQSGEIWQFGPVGKGWVAWHAMAANTTYYGIEHADNGNPDNPLTDSQMTASAQVVECLSAYAGFPLQEANAPGERGYGTHNMGGAAYGGHACPDLPPQHVRSAQRPEIIRRAQAIRAGGTVTPPSGPALHVTAGEGSLAELAAASNTTPAAILHATTGQTSGPWAPDIGAWLNGIFDGTISPAAPMPPGMRLWVP